MLSGLVSQDVCQIFDNHRNFEKSSNLTYIYMRHACWWPDMLRRGRGGVKFNGLLWDSGHRGPYSPYKPCNRNLYIGIIIPLAQRSSCNRNLYIGIIIPLAQRSCWGGGGGGGGAGGGGGGQIYWFHSVRPSVQPASRVRSVGCIVLAGSFSYLYILSINFRWCVACKVYCKV